jgi:hypothetical protein
VGLVRGLVTPSPISRLDSQAPYVSSHLFPVRRGRYWDDAELRVRITGLLSQHRRLRTSSLPLPSARCLARGLARGLARHLARSTARGEVVADLMSRWIADDGR